MIKAKGKVTGKDEAKAKADSQPRQPLRTSFPRCRPCLLPRHQLHRPCGAQLSHSPPHQSLHGAAGPCHKLSRPSGTQLSLLPPHQPHRTEAGEVRLNRAIGPYTSIQDRNIQRASPASLQHWVGTAPMSTLRWTLISSPPTT